MHLPMGFSKALVADLAPERHGGLAAFGHALLQMRPVEASDAQTQRHGLTDARQIGRTAFIAAVNGRAGRATG